jgi:biotin operon repressor
LKSASGGRSAKIAAALVEGKSLAAVARQEGVSRQAIWKQASAVHLRHIVPALVDAEWERIEALFLRTLQAIEEALHADLKRVAKDGTVVELGPDHYARLTAAKRLLELLTAGRLAQKEPEERKPGCTWEDFKALLREQGTIPPG